jgi:hypothetical protein
MAAVPFSTLKEIVMLAKHRIRLGELLITPGAKLYSRLKLVRL